MLSQLFIQLMIFVDNFMLNVLHIPSIEVIDFMNDIYYFLFK